MPELNRLPQQAYDIAVARWENTAPLSEESRQKLEVLRANSGDHAAAFAFFRSLSPQQCTAMEKLTQLVAKGIYPDE